MPLSLQLYSMRNAPDADRVFADCAAYGVSAVEGYGGVIADAGACKRALDEHGLTMPSSHFALDDIRDAPETVIERSKFLGITKVFAPYLDAALRPKTASGYAAIADLLAERGKMFADHGLTVGWHNHDFEFEALEDGALPMQAMFDAQPDLPWEADLGWVIRAGVDPLDWLGNHMANIQAIHVKDLAPAGENANEDGWADLGDGTADWAGIIQTVRTAKPDMLFVLEHDNPSDPYRYLQRSAQAFHSIWETTHG
ncbi:sugar phosphate isomerase/epimerase family protein [Cognatishimia maritima]|uniref:Sugar phosphate isomerase/epimerase n=1 Tax=Cognatishimia maritima TaxID=870908 RepID=A0A1M5N6W6_9RHOB|nr:sugar phosphate isomerase/epimerase [Cognatishimia maritima]SHG85251.1 Sugar phosphate isomerase/epimerase [Cognatishimia maritima]